MSDHELTKKALPEILESTVYNVMQLALNGESKMVEVFIRQAMTAAVFQVKDICEGKIISELGLSEQSQLILEKIEEAIPCSSVHTDLLNSTCKE